MTLKDNTSLAIVIAYTSNTAFIEFAQLAWDNPCHNKAQQILPYDLRSS